MEHIKFLLVSLEFTEANVLLHAFLMRHLEERYEVCARWLTLSAAWLPNSSGRRR
jgi:hypothetical protein